MTVTWADLGDAVYALLVMALLYLGILVGVAVRDFRQWMAGRAARRVPVGDDTLAMLADANADAEIAARTDLYARDCLRCNGRGLACGCVAHCGSQACRGGAVARG